MIIETSAIRNSKDDALDPRDIQIKDLKRKLKKQSKLNIKLEKENKNSKQLISDLKDKIVMLKVDIESKQSSPLKGQNNSNKKSFKSERKDSIINSDKKNIFGKKSSLKDIKFTTMQLTKQEIDKNEESSSEEIENPRNKLKIRRERARSIPKNDFKNKELSKTTKDLDSKVSKSISTLGVKDKVFCARYIKNIKEFLSRLEFLKNEGSKTLSVKEKMTELIIQLELDFKDKIDNLYRVVSFTQMRNKCRGSKNKGNQTDFKESSINKSDKKIFSFSKLKNTSKLMA